MEALALAEDEKLAFYLKHRAQIDEWAALRTQAESTLDRALRESGQRLAQALVPDVVVVEKRWGFAHIFLPFDDSLARVGMGLAWKAAMLMSKGPTLAVTCLDGKKDERYEVVKEATRAGAFRHRLDTFGASEWLWKRQLRPQTDLSDLSDFAEECVGHLREGWLDLRPHVMQAIPT